jgi:sugar fermentation stimulation protein A
LEPCVLLKLALEEAVALRRLNRFVVEVSTPLGTLRLHTRNTGRLVDLIYPGSTLLYAPRELGKTRGVIVGVRVEDEAAAIIDPPTQAAAFEEAWARGLVGWLGGWRALAREARYRGSRIDYAVEGPGGRGLLELKSAVYLSREGFCMYPDAVSERGRRHVEVLVDAARRGLRAIIAFISAHPLCTGFRPCCEVDPQLCTMLREAWKAGVEVYALKMHLRRDEVILDTDSLPVRLE